MSVFILRIWKICAEVGICHCCNRVCWRVIHAKKLANYVTKLAKKYNVSIKLQENIASFVNRWHLGAYYFGCMNIAVLNFESLPYPRLGEVVDSKFFAKMGKNELKDLYVEQL